MRQPLVLLVLALAVLNPAVAEIAGVAATNGSSSPVKISPGKIMPQGYNHYLETPEVQVKLEYPRAIVLQNTTGDLLFNVTIQTAKRTFSIYIPYEFGVKTSRTYIWTSITNDYRFISVSRLSDRDPIAPEWYRINVNNATGNILPGSHIIRLFNVTAPGVVGRYFFKVFIDGFSIGAKNFPTLVVAGDPNPAYISGTVLDCSSTYFRYKYGYYGGYTYAYGSPIVLKDSEGGKVVADGIALDGHRVVGQAYFNSSAHGRYTLYGLAPGVYNLTAYAAAYSPTPMPRLVRVLAGQSMDGVDLCIYASPRIEGVIWSKCGGMRREWGTIAVRAGPHFGAALVHLDVHVFPGRDLIYGLRGGNTSDFFRYDVISNIWEPKEPSPGPVGAGGSLAFDGLQYVYALQGGVSRSFWAYDVSNNAWQTKFQAPDTVGGGGGLAFDLNNHFVYALRGGDTADFWRYDPSIDIWVSRQSIPNPNLVGAGGSLVFNKNDNNIYALQGGGSSNFWLYNPTTDTWVPRAPLPSAVNAGASLTFSSSDNKIYALAGGGTQKFLRYDPSTDSWDDPSVTDIPVSVGAGGSLIFDNFNNRLYAFVGGGVDDFYEYVVPPSDSWSARADFPPGYPRPITIEILDPVDNSLRLIESLTDPASFNFAFTYDGSIELNGHIPQDGSGYVSGIGLGTYKVRVWVNEYVQPADAIVGFTNNLAVTRIEFDVHRMGRAEILVHFKDFVQGQLTQVIPGKSITVALYDRDSILRGQNSTIVTSGSTSASVVVTGFLGTLRDLGLPQGTYNIRVTIEGFYQPSDFYITISDCSAVSKASLDVFRTGTLLLTIRSVNSQSPPQPQNWRYPGSSIRVEVRDLQGAILYGIDFTIQARSSNNASVEVTGLRAGTYLLRISTFGYFEKTSYVVTIVDGATIDRTVDLVVGGAIDVNVLLEKEDLPYRVDTYRFSYRVPIRIEIYDSTNQFVAANVTYMNSGMTQSTFRLIGFRRYAGNAAYRWVNFYDTTDGSIQRDYGLGRGTYRAIVYVPGFLQDSVAASVTLTEGSRASITLRLDRLAHLTGTVTSLNMFGEVVPLNWAIVDAIGSNMKDFAPTMDGSYDMWLPNGRYLVICSLSGYGPVTKEVPLSKGSDVAINFRLRYITINVPEFGEVTNYVTVIVAVACAASIILTRRPKNRGRDSTDSQAIKRA